MNLPPAVADHKPIVAALIAIARTAAERFGVDAKLPTIIDLAAHFEISRTHIYERAHRVLAAIEPLARREPGRPPVSRERAPTVGEAALTIAVLQHRVDHLDAMIVNAAKTRTVYSPAFRRFILEQHDAWPEDRTLEDFAAATAIPLDTLRDWIATDRAGLTPPIAPARPMPQIPVDANDLVREIATAFVAWSGTTRDFIGTMVARTRLVPGQIARVLLLLTLIRPHRPRADPGPHRYRGATTVLSPGAMLTTDGKQIDIELVGSAKRDKRMWQPMVDQATHAVTASVVGLQETAEAAIHAYHESATFLGGRAPDAVLLDNKPCYDAAILADAIRPTTLISSTPDRPENNAGLEGFFGLFEQHVGTLRFDDSSPEAMITSAVSEVQRAYCAGINHAGRAELGGKSRVAHLREFVPSPEQRERDRRFLERLSAEHQQPRRPRVYPHSTQLLDAAFQADEILRGKDPRGHLRRYLARYQPDVIRLALAQFRSCCERGLVEDERYAHRYLAGVIRNIEYELQLQRAEVELLDLAHQHRQLWTADLERELAQLEADRPDHVDLLRAIAEQAALGGLPVEGAFWTGQLLARLRVHPECSADLGAFLRRCYDAPVERRLSLLDQIAALAHGLN